LFKVAQKFKKPIINDKVPIKYSSFKRIPCTPTLLMTYSLLRYTIDEVCVRKRDLVEDSHGKRETPSHDTRISCLQNNACVNKDCNTQIILRFKIMVSLFILRQSKKHYFISSGKEKRWLKTASQALLTKWLSVYFTFKILGS
jgi:hypothetical protein